MPVSCYFDKQKTYFSKKINNMSSRVLVFRNKNEIVIRKFQLVEKLP